MKLASLKNSTRDGQLVVVSRDLTRMTPANDIAPTLQSALDNWEQCAPALEALFTQLQNDEVPSSAFSPVAVTPDELGEHYSGGTLDLALTTHLNGDLFGAPHCGVDMTFNFLQLIEHVTRTRRLGAGTIIGSGTISNYDRSRGSSCIAEKRMLETLESGGPKTPFMQFGDRVCIEMLDADGNTVFGAIDQTARPLEG